MQARGINVELMDKNKWTAFHYACEAGHAEIVNMLPMKGVRIQTINLADKSHKYTPLMLLGNDEETYERRCFHFGIPTQSENPCHGHE